MKNKKNHELIWEDCLKVIKDNISLQSFKTWFEPISPIRFKNKVLTLQVPSHFFYEWLEEHYVKLLKVALTKAIPILIRFKSSINDKLKKYGLTIIRLNSLSINTNVDSIVLNSIIIRWCNIVFSLFGYIIVERK